MMKHFVVSQVAFVTRNLERIDDYDLNKEKHVAAFFIFSFNGQTTR